MKRWPHQINGLEDIENAKLSGFRRICVTSPTGGGKSLMQRDLIQSKKAPSALYTNRRMLLEQLSAGLSGDGIEHGIRAADHEPRLVEDVQLCMVQTMGRRLERWGAHPSDLVQIDEAHINKEGVVQQLLEAHGEVDLIGWTATPTGLAGMYDKLIIAGTNSELRECGAIVPAHHFAPDEPDQKWIKKIAIDGGECGIPQPKRMVFAQRVFGRIVEQYNYLNPHRTPSILFAPGVKESLWICEELNKQGITAAHIAHDGCWLDGELYQNDQTIRDEIAKRSESGDVNIVCNRFVLREGIDWPWLAHGIFATVFGSVTTYIQAGGRLLRNHSSLDHVTIQDHGGNWWRFGSLNSDRQWELGDTDRTIAGERQIRLREKKEPEPIVCVKCGKVRLSGPVCHACGHRSNGKTRMILQSDGTLKEMRGDIFKPRRKLKTTRDLQIEWQHRVRATQNSKKEHVRNRTYEQVLTSFAMDHNWQWPSRDWPMMPVKDSGWLRGVLEVPTMELYQ